jgi:hypothetical protein
MKYLIGKVIGISGDKIDVLLLDYSEDDKTGVPEHMSINCGIDGSGPMPLVIGQPGSFVEIKIPTGRLLAMVTDIQMRESIPSNKEIEAAKEGNYYLIPTPKRILSVIPIGTIDPGDVFERGTDIFPTVNAEVCAVPSSTLEAVYRSFTGGDFSLGKLSLIPDQDAKINFDSFLSRHAAILGQTGGGKSWTVASFLQKTCTFKQATVVLFDLHGEYKDAFKQEDIEYIDASTLELPYWLMNSEELLDLMVDRSEAAAPNQIAKFKELLQDAKNKHSENRGLGIPKITIDTPVFFDFGKIVEEFRRLDLEMVPGKTGPKNGPLHGQFTRLLMRLDSRLNDQRYDVIFKPRTYNSSASMNDLFRHILGETGVPKKNHYCRHKSGTVRCKNFCDIPHFKMLV